MSSARISWADIERGRGRGPTGTAIRIGKTQVNQNILINPAIAPWRARAVELGYNASIALPLSDGASVFGALTIYSTHPDAFFPDEVRLLEELAGDLAFGIVTIRGRRDREASDERLAFLNAHDPLTGLPNRLLARDRFDQAAAAAERNGSRVAVLFPDIDHFAVINDSLGPETGDALLVQVVERLQKCVRDGDTICRHSGDEFTIYLPAVGDVGQSSGIADSILAAFAEAFEVGGTSITISFSIGISLFPDDGRDIDTLLKGAGAAAHEAMESGGNSYRFFTEAMTVDAMKTMQLRHQMAGALKNGGVRAALAAANRSGQRRGDWRRGPDPVESSGIGHGPAGSIHPRRRR